MPPRPPRAAFSPVCKIGASMVLIIVVLLCMVIANNAKNRAHRSTATRLDLTRKRFEMCDVERRMLSGEQVAAADTEQLAQEEYDALHSENELLREENGDLSQTIAELERQVDDLREELDDKDFISEDEADDLEETLALGNNSKALADLLERESFSDEKDIVVPKAELINMLLAELKFKRTSLAECMALKRVVGMFEGQILWEEMNEQQRNALLRAQVKKIAVLQVKDPVQAEELVQTWGPRHYKGIQGLREDVAKRAANMPVRKQVRKGGKGTDQPEVGPFEEDYSIPDEEGFTQWDWDN